MGYREVFIYIMNYIGIVGSSKAKVDDVAVSICSILDTYNPQDTTIVSGGADGVDKIAVGIARLQGYNILEYKPSKINGVYQRGWQYYRERNLMIANKCDKVYSIALPLNNGKRCYHCAKVGLDDNHYKTAGCWTAQRCKEFEVVVA